MSVNDAIRSNSLVLGIFALITAALLAGTQQGTKERIAASERAVAQRALLEVVPKERHNNDMLNDLVDIPRRFLATLGVDEGAQINVARLNGKPVAYIVPAIAPDGYNGDIKMIIGINTDGSIAGVRITTHNETPGLGDKVETNKADWVYSFDGKSLRQPAIEGWAVKKDGGEFDQFTGATITPRAVVNQVLATLRYFNEDQLRLTRAAEASFVEAQVQQQTQAEQANQ